MVAPSLTLLNGAASHVENAVSRLVVLDTLNGRYRISMPVVTCSGSRVDVSVWPEPGGYFTVSDDGACLIETTVSDQSDRVFRSVAMALSARYGASLEASSLCIRHVSADRLRGAIVSMANLIKEVVDETVERMAKAKGKALKDELFRQLDLAFPGKAIRHDAEVIGDSTASYEVAAIVNSSSGPVIFDVFTRDPISIAAEFTKLSDLSRLDVAPKLVAVTSEPENIGPKLQLIASVAPIIRVDAAIEQYRRLAA